MNSTRYARAPRSQTLITRLRRRARPGRIATGEQAGKKPSELRRAPHFREGGAATLPPDIGETFKMAPGVNPIFPAEGAFEIDVTTPDGRILPLIICDLMLAPWLIQRLAICSICFFEWVRLFRLFGRSLRMETNLISRADTGCSTKVEPIDSSKSRSCQQF